MRHTVEQQLAILWSNNGAIMGAAMGHTMKHAMEHTMKQS